jgi:hypothetical protein
MKYTLCALFVLMISSHCQAQDSHVSIGALVGISRNMGFQNPSLGVTLNGALRIGRVALIGDGQLLSQRKFRVGGNQLNLSAELRYYFSQTIYLAPEVGFAYLNTSEFNKPAARLKLHIGKKVNKKAYLSFNYQLPDTTFNKTSAIGFRAEYYGKVKVKYGFDVARFAVPGRGRLTGLSANLSVGWLLTFK